MEGEKWKEEELKIKIVIVIETHKSPHSVYIKEHIVNGKER